MAVKAACGNGFPLNIPSVIPESGGSGGTSDYSELSNKPSINNVTLSGNKSASDLGLAEASDIPGLATTSAPGIVQPDGTSITIVDGVISAVGGSGSGETYSTNETEIGTWLGAPLYRKVKTYAATSSSSSAQINFNVSNVTVRRCEAYLSRSDTNVMSPLSMPANDDQYNIEMFVSNYNSSPIMKLQSDSTTLYSGYVITGIIEYTKNS